MRAITAGHRRPPSFVEQGVSLKASRSDRRSHACPVQGQEPVTGGQSEVNGGPADDPKLAAKVLSRIIERGSRVQAPAVKAYVDRLLDQHPHATPAQIVKKLERRYLSTVMASGVAVGSAAAFPGLGR